MDIMESRRRQPKGISARAVRICLWPRFASCVRSPNNPNLYNPEKNMDNTLKRKNRILDRMLSDGVINQVV